MDREYKETILAIIATIIISIIVSSLVEFSVVSPYLYATNRAVSIFDFYNHIESNNIYLIGSSQIESGVDARIIGKDVYNLGLSGDTPLRRLIELNRLIETKPRSVIIGLSYFGLDDNYSGVGPSTADQIAPLQIKSTWIQFQRIYSPKKN